LLVDGSTIHASVTVSTPKEQLVGKIVGATVGA
jgi:hypothetical protein